MLDFSTIFSRRKQRSIPYDDQLARYEKRQCLRFLDNRLDRCFRQVKGCHGKITLFLVNDLLLQQSDKFIDLVLFRAIT
ncbi:hypothetical protein D3C77_669760 [compost metagenome]